MNSEDSTAQVVEKLKEYGDRLSSFFESYPLPGASSLTEAMLYSLSAGGKRLRPALCMCWAAIAGCKEDEVLPFACAIEMIHTYSLIHDDLPAMDNDDLRRGKPACHKAFNEATAILAGDGLLTDAFWVALNTRRPASSVNRALRVLAYATGSAGMAGGQMEDMLLTGKNNISLEKVEKMQAKKTGCLLRASCVCGVILGSENKELISNAARYGTFLGRAFQIMDDILDITGTTENLGKPAGSDEAGNKVTWPGVVGIEKSYHEAEKQISLALQSLNHVGAPEKEFLSGLAQYVLSRSA